MGLYFAYGSNKDDVNLRERLNGLGYSVFGKGILKNHILNFDKADFEHPGFGNENIIPNEKEFVEGVVFELNENAFDKLDFSMGLVSGHCCRKPVQIETEKGTIECSAYSSLKRNESGLLTTVKKVEKQ